MNWLHTFFLADHKLTDIVSVYERTKLQTFLTAGIMGMSSFC